MRNKTVGLLLRLRILMRRISSRSDSCKKKSSFFPTRGKFFCQEPVYEILFREETLLSSQDDIHLRKDLCVFSQGYEFLWEESHLCLILVRMLVFPTRTKIFCQQQVNNPSQDDFHLSRISYFKEAYQKNYCSSQTQYLFEKNVSFWVFS